MKSHQSNFKASKSTFKIFDRDLQEEKFVRIVGVYIHVDGTHAMRPRCRYSTTYM